MGELNNQISRQEPIVLHGGAIRGEKLQKLVQFCIQTDDILRKVFAKILQSKSSELDFFKMFTAEEKQLQGFLSKADDYLDKVKSATVG